jgi:hypothetical protein
VTTSQEIRLVDSLEEAYRARGRRVEVLEATTRRAGIDVPPVETTP